VTVLELELASDTLPPGKRLAFNLRDTASLASLKKNPVVIKEGIEYK
jgi:Rho GDP-dissociation inhibitor